MPQQESPETPSPSEIRAPRSSSAEGFSINPSAADGKTACADAEAQLRDPEEAQCPEISKVGIGHARQPRPCRGRSPASIYLGEPQPGNRYRIFLTADGFATHVKLVGLGHPRSRDGPADRHLRNLPQSPFTDFNLHFFGSERGLLATPTQCGTYPVESTSTPWDAALPEPDVDPVLHPQLGPGREPLPGRQPSFQPRLPRLGRSNGAGAHSPFSLEVTRQTVTRTSARSASTTPPGFSATLKGIPYCPEATLRRIEGSELLRPRRARQPELSRR